MTKDSEMIKDICITLNNIGDRALGEDYNKRFCGVRRDNFAYVIHSASNLLQTMVEMPVKKTTCTIRCPKCNKQITSKGALHKDIKFCWKCGQALNWEEV